MKNLNVVEAPKGAKVVLYSSVRDGSQTPGINVDAERRKKIFDLHTDIGIPLVELSFPQAGGDQKMVYPLLKSRKKDNWENLVSFGSLGKPDVAPEKDVSLQALLDTKTEIVTLVAKTWDEQIKKVIGVKPAEYVDAVFNSVRYMKDQGVKVIYDAEHAFTGLKMNPQNALKYFDAAIEAGADNITLCDTKGLAMHKDIINAVEMIKDKFPEYKRWGFHGHNDLGLAVSNSMAFIHLVLENELGIPLVQGTFNGEGERAGNASLSAIIANCEIDDIKTGIKTRQIYDSAKKHSRLMGIRIDPKDPLIGDHATIHTGGQHVDAIRKGSRYLGYDAEKFGRHEGVDYSENSGTAAALHMAWEFGYDDISKRSPKISALLADIKAKALEGYLLRHGYANQALLVEKHMGEDQKLYFAQFEQVHMGTDFITESFTSENEENGFDRDYSVATIFGYDSVEDVRQKRNEIYAKIGQSHKGPVAAIFKGMKEILKDQKKGWVEDIMLIDWHEDIIRPNGVESVVGAYVELSYGNHAWTAFGVGENAIAASHRALRIGMEYGLMMRDKGKLRN